MILAVSLMGWTCCRNRRFRIVDFFSLILFSVPLSLTLSDDEEEDVDDEFNGLIFVVVVVVALPSLRIVGSVENATTAMFVCCHRNDDDDDEADDDDEHVRMTTMATSDSMIADVEDDRMDNEITRSLCKAVYHHLLLLDIWGG